MSQIVEIKVPDIGGHDNVDVIDVAVKAGDTIAISYIEAVDIAVKKKVKR